MEVGTLLIFAVCLWWPVFCASTAPVHSRILLAVPRFLLLRGLALAQPVLELLNELNSQLNGDALACVWKASAILILTQAVQDVCREAGHAAHCRQGRDAGAPLLHWQPHCRLSVNLPR